MITCDPIKRLIGSDVKEIKEAYPKSAVLTWGNGSLGAPTIVLIEEQKYSGQFDRAKYYAEMCAACFIHADIFKGKEYQYTLGTASGDWKERLQELKSAVDKIAKQGLDSVKKDLESEILGISHKPTTKYAEKK
jgi:hypothetical protein